MKIKLPDDLLAQSLKLCEERKKCENKKNALELQEAKEHKRQLRLRMKDGLPYAQKLIDWAEEFLNDASGRELVLAAKRNEFTDLIFFDQNVGDLSWVGLALNTKGISFGGAGRHSSLSRRTVEDEIDLARSVDHRILKEAWLSIQNGTVWDCIRKRLKLVEEVKNRLDDSRFFL